MLGQRARFLLLVGIALGVFAAILSGNTHRVAEQLQTTNDMIASVNVDGRERSFFVQSTTTTTAPQPLLIVLSQSGMSGQGMANLTGFHTLEESQGFVVAYLQSIHFWNDGRVMAGFLPSGEPLDDVQYVERVIDYLAGVYSIDLSQVYLVGYRDGGRMAYHMACQRPQRFRSVAVVGALMWEYIDRNCESSTPTPLNMLVTVSSQSDDYPLTGGQYNSLFDSSRAYVYYSLSETMEHWLNRNRCNSEGNQQIGAARVNMTCAGGVQVASYVYPGGENVWLGANRPNDTGLDLSLLVMQFLTDDPVWMNHTAITSDEIPRNDLLYIPNSYNGSRSVPLVVMLHPTPLNGAEFAYISDMNQIAEREGFILLYPEAINRSWYYDRGYEFGAPTENYNDTEFITSLVRVIESQLNISDVYLVGMSNGGFMTQRIACEMPEQFNAFAVVGATTFPGLDEICAGRGGVPMLMMHGTADADVPWSGTLAPEMSPYQYVTFPVQDSLAQWADHNGCSMDFALERIPATSSDTQVERYRFQECDDTLLFYAVVGGGHAWIGVPNRLPAHFSGKVNTDLNAGEVIWEFLSAY